ncbi:MAG: hypothetical protein GY757_60570, partial [bacterium]|nr:hypothetical protein [bacterium]
LIERAITGKVKPREWQITFQRRLVKEVGGIPGSGLPDGMETLLEIAAWSELRFRHTLAVKVNDYLRDRVLFLPGEQRVPDFSPGVFWALIGLCDIGNYKNQVKYGDMLRAVREEARKQAMKEGWAGAWDQWLIRLARQQWPRAFENRKNEFCQALLGLPVFPQRSHERLPDKKAQKKSPKKKSPPIVLAHPDWENQMMDVLKNSF